MSNQSKWYEPIVYIVEHAYGWAYDKFIKPWR